MLKIKDLSVNFYTPQGIVRAVQGIDLEINVNEKVGLVGESGSGKSVTAYSILRLVDHPGRIERGQVLWAGKDLLTAKEEELRLIRGKEIAMIFQDPFGSLNPVYKVGDQIAEVIRLHQGLDKRTAWTKAVEMIETVHIQDPEKRAQSYPHQLSGGMCQRVMIALALSCRPKLLIADEPTTALDVTIQAEIMDLLREVQQKFNMAVLLITHNLALVANFCERVYVMKDGKIVEKGPVHMVFRSPEDDYTKKLLFSVPRI
jgi:ABC-type dipeptide/oligopeptide/nickel transport system ATPase component